MRIITIAAVAAFAFTGVAASAATPVQKETAVWQAFKDKKADAFRAMFAPNYVGLYEDGASTMAKELDHLKNGKLESFKIDNFASRMFDRDVRGLAALDAGHGPRSADPHGILGGEPEEGPAVPGLVAKRVRIRSDAGRGERSDGSDERRRPGLGEGPRDLGQDARRRDRSARGRRKGA